MLVPLAYLATREPFITWALEDPMATRQGLHKTKSVDSSLKLCVPILPDT